MVAMYPTMPLPGTEPVIVAIGEIQVTSATILTPAGAFPLRGSQWHATDQWFVTQRIPQWAIVMTIVGFLWLFGRTMTLVPNPVVFTAGLWLTDLWAPAFALFLLSFPTGRLTSPLVTIHTTGDQIIPYWHEKLYALKTLLSGSFLRRHINIKIDRYGHCNFKAPEVLAGFAVVVFMANRQPLTGIEAALPDAASREEYRSIVRANGALP
jgi:hypothetical protein